MDNPTKCPICGTVYTKAEKYDAVECGGEGNCPAREAGPRPDKKHVLCACNQRWLHDDGNMAMEGSHGYEHCTSSLTVKVL